MSAKLFHQEDCNLGVLEGKKVAIIGFGSQGHAHAVSYTHLGNREKNTKELVQKCADEGLALGAWTIDDEETMNRLISWGVTTITTNCLTY